MSIEEVNVEGIEEVNVEADLRILIRELSRERGEALEPPASSSEQELFDTFRALVNLRPPAPLAPEPAAAQDRVLQALVRRNGVTDARAIAPCKADERLSLWQGDITRLSADAIVNAANEQGLGCWAPGHSCIDNAIHTFAGTQLRLACARELKARAARGLSRTLRPGEAMMTEGFNLPASYVIHTVGPIVAGRRPSPHDELTLSSCYENCLELTHEKGLRTIAFCCISTGVFGYPQRAAAPVATGTVKRWLDAHPNVSLKVIFDVFLDDDLRIYQEELERD